MCRNASSYPSKVQNALSFPLSVQEILCAETHFISFQCVGNFVSRNSFIFFKCVKQPDVQKRTSNSIECVGNCVQKCRLASAGLWEILCVWTGRLVFCVERRLDFSQSPGNSVCVRV